MRIEFWTLACVALALVGGCKKTDEGESPPRRSMTIVLEDDIAKVDATAILPNGQKQHGAGSFTFTPDKVPSPLPTQATLDVPTPCGSVTLPLKLVSKPAFPGDLHFVGSYDRAAAPKISYVWADAPSGTSLAIGKLEVKTTGTDALKVAGVACAERQDVRLGGASIGALDTKPLDDMPLRKDTIFVSAHNDACYELETKSYGSRAVAPTGPEILRGAQVRHLKDSIDYFLRAAPSEIKDTLGDHEGYATELVQTTCPPD